MKKKISLFVAIMALVLSATGCSGSQKTDITYEKDNVEQAAEFLIDYCAKADAKTIEQWTNMSDFALEQQLVSAGLPFTPDSFLSAMDAWQAAAKECGAYKSHGDYTYETSKKELTVTTDAKFENRDAEITFVFNDKMYLDSVTLDAVYSRGEIIKKAGLNTLLGMGTVFSVLIFISFLISLFRFIPAIQASFSGKPKPSDAVKNIPAAAPATVIPDQQPSDDAELIAVIAAAIAAAEGTSIDGFIVRSIKRRPANRWN